MADRIIHTPSPAGDIGIYAIVRARADGKVWDGAAMGAWLDASIGTYDIALPFLGGDAYGYTVPATLPVGATYIAAFYRRASVVAEATTVDIKLPDEWEFAWNGAASVAPGPGEAAWTYANQQAVSDLLGALNLTIGGDLDSDGTIDAGLVQRDGEWSDSYIDLELSRNSITVPVNLLTADDHIVAALEDISAHLTAWYIWHHRGLQDQGGRTSDAIAGIMQGYKAYADEQLAKLIGAFELVDEDDDAAPAGSFEFVPIVRAPICTADENSD